MKPCSEDSVLVSTTVWVVWYLVLAVSVVSDAPPPLQGGITLIHEAIEKLKKTHKEHIQLYDPYMVSVCHF